MFALEDSELLTESKILQQQPLVRTKDEKQCSEPEPEDVEHDSTVIAGRIRVCSPMSLISKPRIIVARDRGRIRDPGIEVAPSFSEEISLRNDPTLGHFDLVHPAKREEELH